MKQLIKMSSAYTASRARRGSQWKAHGSVVLGSIDLLNLILPDIPGVFNTEG